jgi:hypothetical protein
LEQLFLDVIEDVRPPVSMNRSRGIAVSRSRGLLIAPADEHGVVGDIAGADFHAQGDPLADPLPRFAAADVPVVHLDDEVVGRSRRSRLKVVGESGSHR